MTLIGPWANYIWLPEPVRLVLGFWIILLVLGLLYTMFFIDERDR